MKIFLGSDHAGFKFKEKIKKVLDKKNISYEDCGTYSENPCDYPDYAFLVGKHVAQTPDSKGILVCGTGAGMCIAANKVEGIRAAEAHDVYTAKMSREHNDSNILCLQARKVKFTETERIVSTWLKTKFSKEVRHLRRVQKISAYEY